MGLSLPFTDLLLSTTKPFGPLLLNLLAPANVTGVGRSLTLDAAVPIDVAATAALRRDTGVIGTAWVGAGFGLVVAGTASNRSLWC